MLIKYYLFKIQYLLNFSVFFSKFIFQKTMGILIYNRLRPLFEQHSAWTLYVSIMSKTDREDILPGQVARALNKGRRKREESNH